MVMMDKWMKPETLKAMISNGLHFALLGAGDGPVCRFLVCFIIVYSLVVVCFIIVYSLGLIII